MTALFDTVVGFFRDQDWPFAEHLSREILRVDYLSDDREWPVYVRVVESASHVVVLSVLPAMTPEGRRPAMAEFITRANYGLDIGNFEMDYSDGEVRCRTSIHAAGPLEPAMVGTLVAANVTLMDEYFSGLLAMMNGDASAVDEIAAIEG